jgi:hypothetical protein
MLRGGDASRVSPFGAGGGLRSRLGRGMAGAALSHPRSPRSRAAPRPRPRLPRRAACTLCSVALDLRGDGDLRACAHGRRDDRTDPAGRVHRELHGAVRGGGGMAPATRAGLALRDCGTLDRAGSLAVVRLDRIPLGDARLRAAPEPRADAPGGVDRGLRALVPLGSRRCRALTLLRTHRARRRLSARFRPSRAPMGRLGGSGRGGPCPCAGCLIGLAQGGSRLARGARRCASGEHRSGGEMVPGMGRASLCFRGTSIRG